MRETAARFPHFSHSRITRGAALYIVFVFSFFLAILRVPVKSTPQGGIGMRNLIRAQLGKLARARTV